MSLTKRKGRNQGYVYSVIGTLVMITDVALFIAMFLVNADHCQAMADANGRDGPTTDFIAPFIAGFVGFVILGVQWSVTTNPEARGRSGVGDVLRTVCLLLVLALTIRGLVEIVNSSC